jgi:hypothetical protein
MLMVCYGSGNSCCREHLSCVRMKREDDDDQGHTRGERRRPTLVARLLLEQLPHLCPPHGAIGDSTIDRQQARRLPRQREAGWEGRKLHRWIQSPDGRRHHV